MGDAGRSRALAGAAGRATSLTGAADLSSPPNPLVGLAGLDLGVARPASTFSPEVKVPRGDLLRAISKMLGLIGGGSYEPVALLGVVGRPASVEMEGTVEVEGLVGEGGRVADRVGDRDRVVSKDGCAVDVDVDARPRAEDLSPAYVFARDGPANESGRDGAVSLALRSLSSASNLDLFTIPGNALPPSTGPPLKNPAKPPVP